MKRHLFHMLIGLAMVFLCTALAPAIPPKGSVVINEVVIDSRGGNPELEFIELYSSQPNFEIGGLSLLCIEGRFDIPGEPVGMILRRFDVPERDTTDSQGFYLVANQRTQREYQVQANVSWEDQNRIPNDDMTIILVATREALPEKAVINPNTLFPSGLWDSVALVGPRTSRLIFFNAPIVGPDGQWIAAGATRIRDGFDTDQPQDWALADIEGPPQSYNTPGKPNNVPGQMTFFAAEPTPQVPQQMAGQSTPLPAAPPAQPATQPTPQPAPAPAAVSWQPYSAQAMTQAIRLQGSALVYVRSAHTRRCLEFERAYLLEQNMQTLLANRPLFYLNAHEPGKSGALAQLGVFRVPTLVFQRRAGAREYLTVTDQTSAEEIYLFLVKR